MKNKILIGLTIIGLLYLLFAGYAEYLWQTKGAGMIIDRQKALGVSINEYKIRDQDLELIKSYGFDKVHTELMIKIAQDEQDIMLKSNDLEWIKKNGWEINVREFCIIRYQSIQKSKGIKDKGFLFALTDNDERAILYEEYSSNYEKLGLSTYSPTEDERIKICYEK